MGDEAGAPVVAEIADLLDQCSPDELASILQAIEGGNLDVQLPVPQATAGTGSAGASPAAPTQAQDAQMMPVAPAGPPPGGGGPRRPQPAGVKRVEAEATEENRTVTMEEMRQLLEQHSASVLSEVRKLLPADNALAIAPGACATDAIDMETLTKTLVERDREVKMLEDRLSGLQGDLQSKDNRVMQLGSELDNAVREVRHRQLDLEFQQLKLEERVRSNAELEQAQRNLSMRVEEASLNARHAAIDVDICRTSPRAMRAQGSLPWTLRKNRPVGTLPPTGAPQ